MAEKENLARRRPLLLRFLTETPFHGFNITANTKSSFELMTWLLVICTCVSFAIYQTVALVTEYRSERTVTRITVNRNGTFSSHSAHLGFSWNFDARRMTLPEDSVSSILSRITEEQLRYYQLGQVTPSLLEPSVFRLVFAMLMGVMKQYGNIFNTEASHRELPWGVSSSRAQPDSVKNSALYQVHQFFTARNISMGKLKQILISVACQVSKRVNIKTANVFA